MQHHDQHLRPYGPKRHLARLFGVKLVSDIPEKLCRSGVRPILDAKRRARLRCIRDAGVAFVHVPKNAGMSISSRLYGQQIKHATVRYYAKVAPGLLDAVESFAILREPVARFLSAYGYARAGGSGDNRVSAPFRELYMSFQSIDDVLDHVEGAASAFAVDHIFRAQHWYVLDEQGVLRVRNLIGFDRLDSAAMPGLVGGAKLDHLNNGTRRSHEVTPSQRARILRLYARDVELYQACV